MSITWLHTADLHLGQPVKGLRCMSSDMLAKRLAEYMLTFERIILLASQKRPNFLFIAGDFLEHGYLDLTTLDKIKELLHSIPSTRIFIAPGNHDPYRADSYYALESWSDNVHIFSSKWEEHSFAEYDLSICGQGFADFSERTFNLPTKVPAGRKICVIHGTLVASDLISDYLPLLERDLSPLEFDYIAGGHVHKSGSFFLANEKKTLFRYPGSPEALNWKELGDRSVTWGTLDENGVNITPLTIQTRSYCKISCKISVQMTEDDILDSVMTQLKELLPTSFIKIVLTGRLHTEIIAAELCSRMLASSNARGYKYIFIEDETKLDFDLEYLRQRPGIVSAFIKKIETDMLACPERESELQNVLYTGLSILIQDVCK